MRIYRSLEETMFVILFVNLVASFFSGKVVREQLMRIFLFLVDSIVAVILSSKSTVKSLSIISRV